MPSWGMLLLEVSHELGMIKNMHISSPIVPTFVGQMVSPSGAINCNAKVYFRIYTTSVINTQYHVCSHDTIVNTDNFGEITVFSLKTPFLPKITILRHQFGQHVLPKCRQKLFVAKLYRL